MKKVFWQHKLTPFDWELCVMIESLTGRECFPKNGGDSYLIEANYEAHAGEPEYLLAVWDAIEGRAGKRLKSIKDDPDRTRFVVQIEFSGEEYPDYMKRLNSGRERPEKGETFCRQLTEIRALQVSWDNAERLFEFVGNGEMEGSDDVPCVFTFINAAGSVFARAMEGDYIVYVGPGRFDVFSKELFEERYESK